MKALDLFARGTWHPAQPFREALCADQGLLKNNLVARSGVRLINPHYHVIPNLFQQ